MKQFLFEFFTQGSEPEFAIFTFAHFAPVCLMIAVILLIARQKDWIRQYKHEEKLRWALSFALIISEMSYYWRQAAGAPWLQSGPVQDLPIGVCGWAVIFCSYMLVSKNQTLFDISYFWLLSGSLFALITPTPLTYTGPARFRYYQFWLEHTLGYVAIFYMIFVHGMRPTVKSAVKSFAALLAMAVLAFGVNSMIPGANYLYVARPESAPSVLDILPPNMALRFMVIFTGIVILYILAYVPWYLKDRKAAKNIH